MQAAVPKRDPTAMGWKKLCSAASLVTTSGMTAAPCAAQPQRNPRPVGESGFLKLLPMSPSEALMWLGGLTHGTLSCGQALEVNPFISIACEP